MKLLSMSVFEAALRSLLTAIGSAFAHGTAFTADAVGVRSLRLD
jgi:hypothetical protein